MARISSLTISAIVIASKADAVRAFGADAVVDRSVDDVPGAAVRANGARFDVVADVVGGGDFGGWLDALVRGGRYVTSGAIAGPVVELDLRTMYLHDLELYGATVFEPQVFADLVGYIERGEIAPVVAATYPLEEIVAAQERFLAKDFVGKLVLEPPS